MKSSKVLLSIILVLSILVVSILPTLAENVTALDEDELVSPESKISETLKVKMEEAEEDEKIPVWIWYKDIDQDVVDTAVKNELGYTIDKIDQNFEMPDDELLSCICESSDCSRSGKMNTYLERTSVERACEKKRTDDYIMKRREISRNKYNHKAESVIKMLSIHRDSIFFQSQYAPVIIAELTKADILGVYNSNKIESLDYYIPLETEEECSICLNNGEGEYSTTSNTILNQAKIENKLGLTGSGISIGECDFGYAANHSEYNYEDIICVNETNDVINMSSHAAHVTSILIGNTRGFSKDATIYSTNLNPINIERLITLGVKIINHSAGWLANENSYDSSYAYYSYEKWYDHIIAQHNVSVIVSAGNNKTIRNSLLQNDYNFTEKRIIIPGLAYNVITVGNYCSLNNLDVNDDELDFASVFKNSNRTDASTGIEKPDVVVPAVDTSSAAPMVTGMIAQILELKPSLAAYPQAIKSILLASCHRKVGSSLRGEDQETMTQGITECQGAGVPDVWTMAAIVSQGTYGMGSINSNESILHLVRQPAYNATSINVSLSWIKNNTSSGNHNSYYSISERISADLYLKLISLSNGCIGSSDLLHSSTEMLYTDIDDASDNSDYQIKIHRSNDGNNESVRYAFAYSLDNTYLTPLTLEGIYFIKNAYTGEYLTYDENTNNLITTGCTYQPTKIWIIRKVGSNYQLSPVYAGTNDWIVSGNKISDHNYYSAMGNTSNTMLILRGENNFAIDVGYSAFAIRKHENNSNYDVFLDDNSSVIFTPISSGTLLPSQMWELHKFNYRRGDSNADESYEITDALHVQQYLSQIITLNKLEFILSDADYDGNVTVLDSTKIQRILADIDIY